MSFKIVQIDQGTPQWHAWRSEGIGASEAKYIYGERGIISDYLVKSKTEAVGSFSGNAATRRGQQLEPIARAEFEFQTQRKYRPICIQNISRPWLRASLDGLSACGKYALEIKCGPSVCAKAALGEIPREYMAQLQYIMTVTGFREIDYWCYFPNITPAWIRVFRDEEAIGRLIYNGDILWQKVASIRRGLR